MTISIYQYKWNTLTISVIKNVFLWLRRVAGLCGPDGEGPAVTQYPPVKSAICSVQQFLVWPLLTDLGWLGRLGSSRTSFTEGRSGRAAKLSSAQTFLVNKTQHSPVQSTLQLSAAASTVLSSQQSHRCLFVVQCQLSSLSPPPPHHHHHRSIFFVCPEK